MQGIYKITNPQGKVYIGQSMSIENRKKSYKLQTQTQGQPKIHNSIQKYGFENHEFDIIEECSLEDLDIRETYWKQYYLNQVNMNWDMVLFCGLHDSGGGPKSEEHKRKIGNGNRGKIISQEIRDKISKSQPKTKYRKSETNVKIGLGQPKNKKPCSEIRKEKISEANKGKKFNLGKKYKTKKFKPIIQYDLEGNFIKEWPSAKDIDLHFQGRIYDVLNSNGKKYGYMWKYK